jgi:hypothetical protein
MGRLSTRCGLCVSVKLRCVLLRWHTLPLTGDEPHQFAEYHPNPRPSRVPAFHGRQVCTEPSRVGVSRLARRYWWPLAAQTVIPLTPAGHPIVPHARQFGTTRTDSVDARTTAHRLWQHPGAWRNSALRERLPAAVRAALSRASRAERKAVPCENSSPNSRPR